MVRKLQIIAPQFEKKDSMPDKSKAYIYQDHMESSRRKKKERNLSNCST